MTTSLKIAGYAVHLLTASAMVLGLFTCVAIAKEQYLLAFLLMALSVMIDAVDGTLARKAHVKTTIPNIDGALLDNIADFINYVLTPCFLAIHYTPMLPNGIREVLVSMIVIASAYQFTQTDAKTDDHFFKGFPSYWNIAIFYFYLYSTSPWLNALTLFVLVILVFVPIKYIYLSRLEHAVKNKQHRLMIHGLSVLYTIAILGMIVTYPRPWPGFLYFTLLYTLGYFSFSFYLTLKNQ